MNHELTPADVMRLSRAVMAAGIITPEQQEKIEDSYRAQYRLTHGGDPWVKYDTPFNRFMTRVARNRFISPLVIVAAVVAVAYWLGYLADWIF